MKCTYFAVQIEENGKYYTYAIKVSENNDLLTELRIPHITAANICTGKRQAAELVEHWNTCHKANGCYLFTEHA